MIRSIKIKCPLCGEESELFLSMNPTVIVLNCPECWTPIMYANDTIRILSEHELNTITAPSAEAVLENFFDKIAHKKHMSNRHTRFEEPVPSYPKKKHALSGMTHPHQYRDGNITTDDILNLRIELAQCKDVLQFIENM